MAVLAQYFLLFQGYVCATDFLDQHFYMTHSYPTNQILQYLYRDLPALEYLETEHEIETNPEWNKTYHRLKDVIALLPGVQFFPKRSVVRSVLQYSANQA